MWTATAGSLSDDQTTRNGISDKQWTTLASLVGVTLRAVETSAVGLPYDGPYDVFTTNGPTSDTVVVFAPARPAAQGTAWGWKALVAVWTSGGVGFVRRGRLVRLADLVSR